MVESEKKRMGRPPVHATPVTVRIPPDLLAWVDAERAKIEPKPSRPEFIRQLIEERKGWIVNALTTEQLLEWLRATSAPDEPPNVTQARFQKTFGLGTPRAVFKEMEANFLQALIYFAHSKRSSKG